MNLKVEGQQFDYWNDFSLTLQFDGVGSLFSFSGYFEPENEQHKKVFKPFSYKKVEVLNQKELLLTGTILNPTFTDEATDQLVTITGYSLPGVLEDSSIPVSLYPLQSDNRSLSDIAKRLIQPFGLNLVIDSAVSSDANKKIKVSTADEGKTIKQYLTEIAAQKNIIITHNEKGDLVFTRAKTTGNPVTVFEHDANVEKMNFVLNGQKMHSEITVQKQADILGGNAGESTIKNPYAAASYRTLVKTQSSGTDVDTDLAARNVLSSELKNIVLDIEVDRWYWSKNNQLELMKPNNLISVIAPKLYIYKKTNFFVEAVTFTGTEEKQVATLRCVLPEVYNTNTPKNIFDA